MGRFHLLFHLSLLLLLLTPLTATSNPAIARFQAYLRIDTSHPSPNYSAAVDFLLAQSHPLNLTSQVLSFVPNKPLLLLQWPGQNPSLPSILLNSHTDVVPAEPAKWSSHPFAAAIDVNSNVLARGAQDMKCVSMQYLEAIRRLKGTGFQPERTVYLSFVPDEEIGGDDGAGEFAASEVFKRLGVGVVLDEGLASPGEEYRVFNGERSPWWTVVRASGAPGHGAKMYDGSAMENLMRSVEVVRRFRTAQFDLVKAGERAEGEVVSVNMVYLKAGTPSNDVRFF